MILSIIKEFVISGLDLISLGKIKSALKKEYPTLKLSGKVVIKNSTFGSYNYVLEAKVFNSSLNDFSYIASQSYINNCKIGKFTCIGPNVKIGLGEHPTKEFISIHPVFYSKAAQLGFTFSDGNYFEEFQNTIIGNDVWIGANVIIKGGVTIGDGAVIASGAIVTKDVEPYSIYGGVPAKFLKLRFSKEEIEKLELLRWWDKDFDWLKENYKHFHSVTNINKMIK
ncbi:CatB-related O-acetyltransferase [Tenacibaculum platacis]|uniref:CatB-related O-acetyltransferase n=1 Tax=Tenacibaculum platacis TaxID=3137852 RepID=UPI0031FAB6EF